MAKAPDWLLNMMNSDDNLVEDSPQFRAKEAERQQANLHSAADAAMQAVAERTRQHRQQTTRHQMDMLDRITPTPTPLAGPDQTFFTGTPTDEHTLSDGSPDQPDLGPIIRSPGASPAPMGANTGPGLGASTDPATEVQRISDATGIPPQTIAGMALLGQDIGRLEQSQPPMPTPTEGTLPRPLLQPPAGVPPTPTGGPPSMPPLLGPPPAAPAAPPMTPPPATPPPTR